MNSCQEIIDFLFNLPSKESKREDLSSTITLAKKLGSPEKQFPSVHIAGTNGKGTVAFKMGATLQENGYRVGLYTSPHIFTYRERIQINGKPISEEEVVNRVKKILPMVEEAKFFEITTLMAFDYFADEEVDIAIVETGLGGRLDPTNILNPIQTIITSIQKDHMNLLGKTLDEIAKEKGGIIKEKTPLILGESALRDPILKIAEEKKAPIILCRKGNTSIAQKGLKALPFEIEEVEGLKKNPPCRFEKEGSIIYDVAHNPAAFTHLFERIQKEYRKKKIHVLIGLSKDKDLKSSLAVIQKYADHIALFPSSHPRLIHADHFDVGVPMNFEEAKAYALKENALLVATGSFYIMKDLKHPETSP
ncbi:MAG: bifunctional folylpolyglutamate synthase/dihydrofolate synthase [Chlamydiia bacterium]|nr:bifunctional folylpolyglutamate synthase/dihydrofolate synthase [Chlamydiia bacterium]